MLDGEDNVVSGPLTKDMVMRTMEHLCEPIAMPGLCDPRVWDRIVTVWGEDAEEVQMRLCAMNADRRKIPLTGVGAP